MIQVENLVKHYAKVKAVDGVSFHGRPGRNLWPARSQRRRQDDDHPHHDGHHQARQRGH